MPDNVFTLLTVSYPILIIEVIIYYITYVMIPFIDMVTMNTTNDPTNDINNDNSLIRFHNYPSEVGCIENPDWISRKMPQICVVELTQPSIFKSR